MSPLKVFVWAFALFALYPIMAKEADKAEVHAMAPLDTVLIRNYYLDAEFIKVVDSLESWRKNGSVGTHADSVFAYRHLGIVYASEEWTHNRSESYLNLLLRLEPQTDILDPFISPSVESFWESVKTRSRRLLGVAPEDGDKKPASRREGKAASLKADKGGFPWLWTLTGTAVAGGVIAYYLLSQETPGAEGNPSAAVRDTANIRILVTQ
jgi:hypothetical protein